MSSSQLLSRISIDPNICVGKPCIKGHRIWVSLILDFLASGATMAEILSDYPQLEMEDILACIAYGAEMSRGRFVDILGKYLQTNAAVCPKKCAGLAYVSRT
jgi:uncharacterized protein (DUF433 family)